MGCVLALACASSQGATMTIQVQCPCGARLTVGDQFAGKRGKCPKCGAVVAIPAEAAPVAAEQSPSPAAFPGQQAAPSFQQPQLFNPLQDAPPYPGQPAPPPDPAAGGWGNGAGWPGTQPPPGMVGGQGMMGTPGTPAYSGFMPPPPQMGSTSSRKSSGPKVNVDSDTVKRIGKIAGGIVGFAVAFLVSFLVRNGFQGGSGLGNLGWQPHHSAMGRFRVEFPGRPQSKSQLVPSEVGVMTLWLEGVELRRGTAFIVMYSDVPAQVPLDAQTILDEGVAGLGTQFPTRNVSRIEHDGHPGREVYYTANVDGRSMYARAWVMLAGRRLYQVHYIGKEGTEQHADVQRFLNSFHPD